MRDGIRYVNDSISTTPHATLAALDCFPEQRVALIVGGFDRGVPWDAFVNRCKTAPPAAVFTRGQNGPAIRAALAPLAAAGGFMLAHCDTLAAALDAARGVLGDAGVVLLSPGAPSFPEFRDYVERGRAFAQAAGFDPEAISSIPGLGMAAQ
jgi:UDP-N-acetylmuramoylalanine--D-glutamate ligase